MNALSRGWRADAIHWNRTNVLVAAGSLAVVILFSMINLMGKDPTSSRGPQVFSDYCGPAAPDPTPPRAGPNFTACLEVRGLASTEWGGEAEVPPATTATVRLMYRNTGDIQQDNVVMRLALPEELGLVVGTTALYTSRNPSGVVLTDNLAGTGVNTGSYSPGATGFVVASIQVVSADSFDCGKTTLTPRVAIRTHNGTKSSEARLVVDRFCK